MRETENGAFITLTGELDLAASTELEAQLDRLERRSPGTIVIDLRNLAFIDSSGLRLLLAADARARNSGRRVAFVRGPDAVQRVFEMALLDRRLSFVFDTGDEP